MSKIRVSKAVEMFEVSQSGIYRDMDNGTISFEKDERGKKVIDVAELQCVYQLRENGNSPNHEVGTNGNAENGAVIAVLEEQVELLKEQLEAARSLEKNMVTERQKQRGVLALFKTQKIVRSVYIQDLRSFHVLVKNYDENNVIPLSHENVIIPILINLFSLWNSTVYWQGVTLFGRSDLPVATVMLLLPDFRC